jgi:broad specificity phosphatase PhoE
VALLRFLTHPQVRISSEVPVPRWGLSDVGRTRAEAMARQPWITQVARIVSSGETKALETAAIIAVANGRLIEVRESLHENDRSATGYVPSDAFELLADAFFAEPTVSIRGWETAQAVQQRMVAATADLLTWCASDSNVGDVLLVGHGAAGTLLGCFLANAPISRAMDQVGGEAAPGGGNMWTYDVQKQEMVHHWRAADPR